ncbi:MFS transporter [Saccharothrix longispora]|uniref:MFS transporter n=1 Tax=Saccharothrix longispora TaxID=33920 RepID=UPI0028FD614D|nr:MFS transporter [Saccharothrix longispora]MDU0290764.1 MFS transporter [Saccharothrix longispora]
MSGTSEIEADRKAAGAAPPETAMPGWGFRVWAMLIVVCGAFMLDALDNIMVGIATPPIQAEFGMSNNTLQWVVSAYVLGFGGFLLLGGRMADLAGRRRVFLVGVAVFAAGSLLGGLGDTSVMVVVGRFVMGIGAAFTAPAALSIIITSFPAGAQRNRALGIYTACGAVGYSTGVIVGGTLTELGWRWTFLLPVPIVAIVFLGGLFLVPRDPAPVRGRKYDVAGAVTITAAMLLLVFAIVEAPSSGLLAARTAGAFAAAIVLIAAFVVIERRAAEPLLRLGLLRVPSLVGASLVAAAILGTYMSFQFIGGLYLQSYLGWSPLQMGLAFLPVGLLIMIIAPRAGKLIGRFGVHGMIFAGFVAYTLSYALFLRIDDSASYWWVVFPSVALIGVAFPFSFPAANVLATSDVADEEQGVAAGVLQTGYQVGAAIVLAVIAAISSIEGGVQGDRATQLESYHTSLHVLLGISLVTTVLTLIPALRARRRAEPASASA